MLGRVIFKSFRRPQTVLSCRCIHQQAETSTTQSGILQFASHGEKKPRKNPFMKVMVSGSIDHELLDFPEALSPERYRDFFFWVKRVDEFLRENEHLPRAELISELARLGVFRGSISLQYGGLDFSETELTKLIDILSYVPWLGALLAKTNIPVAKILQAHASDEVKNTYLNKIAIGELQPTLSYLESVNKWNINEVQATCMLSDTGDHWLLNGKKLYVANAEDSNLFLVFARCIEGDVLNLGNFENNPLIMLLVEKDPETMVIEPVTEVVGLKDLKYATVTFKETRVPRANMIGTEEVGRAVFIDLLAPQNQYTGAQCIGLFKRCLTDLINFTLSRKHLDQNLHESQMMKVALGELAFKLFTMESLVYMTCGLEDVYANQDVEMERSIANYYCADNCVDSILNCLKLIGPECVYGEDRTMEYLKDALQFAAFDISKESTKNLLALQAIQYYAKGMKDLKITKLSPFETPGSLLEKFFNAQPQSMFVPGQLHPGLKPALMVLSRVVQKLNGAMNLVVYRYGKKVAQEQAECGKVGEMIVNCYTLATVLCRASRSYCIGLRNSQFDIDMALTLAIRVDRNIEILYKDIDDGVHIAGITSFEKIANELYQKKGYFVEDALKRNW